MCGTPSDSAGEGVNLTAGETLGPLHSGVPGIELTGLGGVYLGRGVDAALLASADSLLPRFSGVSPPANEVHEISSGVQGEPSMSGVDVQGESSMSGVEPLLRRSCTETLPLSSEKGEQSWVSGE